MFRPRRATFTPSALWNDLSPVEWLIRKLSGNSHMQPATWLVSREVTEEAGPWDTRLSSDDDGEYFCRALMASDGVRFVPEARVYYRISGSGRLSHIGQSTRKMEAMWLSMRLHMRYLRSLEDSSRVRDACVAYMRTWLPAFYPERPDIVEEMHRCARELGGRLEPPRFSWKYEWIRRVFGREQAKKAQVVLRELKWNFLRRCDQALCSLEGERGRACS
jgi:hypothetical protein